MGEGGGGDEGAVLDADAVVDFVAFFEAAEDGDGVCGGGLGDLDGLEAAFEGGVFFDVLAVFVEGGGADAAELAPGELGLEEVAGVHGAFGFAGTDDGVELVYEEDDSALAGGDFEEECFEAFFEVATIFGAGHHGAEVHADEAFVFEGLGDVAGDDAACEAFGDGGFTDAGFADEDGVVFGFATEDLHDAADLMVAADDGIYFSGTGAGGEVGAVFFEGLVFGFGFLVDDGLVAAYFLDDGEEGGGGECFEEGAELTGLVGEGEEEVFYADVVVLELLLLGLCVGEEGAEGW